MAFYDAAFAPTRPLAPVAVDFDRGGRLGVFIGAVAAGAMLGAAAGMAIGLVHPYVALGGVAALTALAAFFAGKTFLHCARGRHVAVASAVGLHIASLIAMPIVLLAAPAFATLALYAAFASLLFFTATMRLSNACVGRLAAHAMLLAAAGAYYGLYALMS